MGCIPAQVKKKTHVRCQRVGLNQHMSTLLHLLPVQSFGVFREPQHPSLPSVLSASVSVWCVVAWSRLGTAVSGKTQEGRLSGPLSRMEPTHPLSTTTTTTTSTIATATPTSTAMQPTMP